MTNNFHSISDYSTFTQTLNQLQVKHRCCSNSELVGPSGQRFTLKLLFDFAETHHYLSTDTLNTFTTLNNAHQKRYVPYSSTPFLEWIVELIKYVGYLIAKCFGMSSSNSNQNLQKDINRVELTLESPTPQQPSPPLSSPSSISSTFVDQANPPPIASPTPHPVAIINPVNTEMRSIDDIPEAEIFSYFHSIADSSPEKLPLFFDKNIPLYENAKESGKKAFKYIWDNSWIFHKDSVNDWFMASIPRFLEMGEENLFIKYFFKDYLSVHSHFLFDIIYKLFENKSPLLNDFMKTFCSVYSQEFESLVIWLGREDSFCPPYTLLDRLCKILAASRMDVGNLVDESFNKGSRRINYVPILQMIELLTIIRIDLERSVSRIKLRTEIHTTTTPSLFPSKSDIIRSSFEQYAMNSLQRLAPLLDTNQFLHLFHAFGVSEFKEKPFTRLLLGILLSNNLEKVRVMFEALWKQLTTITAAQQEEFLPNLFLRILDADTLSVILSTFPYGGNQKWLIELLTVSLNDNERILAHTMNDTLGNITTPLTFTPEVIRHLLKQNPHIYFHLDDNHLQQTFTDAKLLEDVKRDKVEYKETLQNIVLASAPIPKAICGLIKDYVINEIPVPLVVPAEELVT